MSRTVLLVLSLATLAVESQRSVTPLCSSRWQWIRDPFDCRHFWRCVWGQPVEMPRCPPGTVLSTKLNNCVWPGSVWDDCRIPVGQTNPPRTTSTTTTTTTTPTPIPLTPGERCARGEQTFPHPEHCQLYYNCTQVYRPVPRFFEQYLKECPYPQLFDAQRLECRDFQSVSCGYRKEPIDACEYRRYWCPVSHCITCSIAHPSCRGLPDGSQQLRGREWSPDYLECFKGRTMRQAQCEEDLNFKVPRVFHPERRQCVNMFRISRERGGIMPSCDGRFDGAYPVRENIPGIEYICSGGQLQNLRYCPQGNSGRPEPRTCVFS